VCEEVKFDVTFESRYVLSHFCTNRILYSLVLSYLLAIYLLAYLLVTRTRHNLKFNIFYVSFGRKILFSAVKQSGIEFADRNDST